MIEKEPLAALLRAVRAIPLAEGCHPTALPYLSFYRFTGRTIPMPQAEERYLYAVLDGSLRLYTPSGMLDYVAGQYSLSQIDTPRSGRVLTRSVQGDFLAMSVELPPSEVISVVLELDGDLSGQIARGELDDGTADAADRAALEDLARLTAVLDDPVGRTFLGRQLRRELIFHLLCGTSGSQFLRSVIQIPSSDEIYEINSWIKEHYRRPFTVEELAARKNMSVSQFYQKFKSAVGMGPLQCQKRLRLTEARRLMLDEGRNVTEAAMEVGYESVSQFTREYRRMYGEAPKADIRRIRQLMQEQANFS